MTRQGVPPAFAAERASAQAQPGAAKTYVLVHGAWHGGWCWRPVADALRAQGHRVFAPTQTGLGERRHLLSRDVTLDVFVDDVANLMEAEELRDAVLVTLGGKTVEQLADMTARDSLRVELRTATAKALHTRGVKRVYFPQFVIQ